jgi:N-acetylglucosamine repressor
MPTPIGNRTLIRALNRSTVLNAIKRFGPIDRAEVARRTGLSPATVTGITAELIEDNLIFEKAPGESRGGRRPILMAINPHGGYVVGVKLTEAQATGALTDLEANVIARQTRSWKGQAPQEAVEVIVELVHELIAGEGLHKKQLLGVGVGLAGIVDAERGLLRTTPYFDWYDLPLRDLLQKAIKVPVYVDNDVNTLTLAEKWFGAGQGVDDFLTVTIGRGVGLGIVVNGQFYRGVGGGAGEFGHTVVDPHGPACACGKRGCLETFVGDPGLVRMAREAFQDGLLPAPVSTVPELIALADAGQPAAQEILARAGKVLGRGIANLINLFNPQLIILGGEGTRAGDWLFEPMRREIAEHTLPRLAADVTLRIDPWGDDAWARGAASLVLRELFESPVHREETLQAA